MVNKDLFSVEDKIILITGSSRGIGFTLAKEMSSRGARIILNGRNKTKFTQAAKSLEKPGYEIHISVFNVFDEKTVIEEIKTIENKIGPGYFLTEMTEKLAEDQNFDNWIKNRTPAGRWGEPDELAGTAIFLSSDASNFISGQIIYVDGGLLSGI